MLLIVTTFGGPAASNAAADEVEYEEDEDEYDDDDYFPSEKASGDLESRSSKSEKEDKIAKEVKIVKESELLPSKSQNLKVEALSPPPPPKVSPIQKDIISSTSTTATPREKPEITSTTPSTSPRSSKNFNVNTSESSKIFSQNSPTQKQQAAIPYQSIKYHRLTQTQNGKTTTYPAVTTTEKAPETLKAKVPEEKKYQTRFMPSKHQVRVEDKNEAKSIENGSGNKTPDTYVTVTKSVTGSVDNTKTPAEDKQNFASTYYTKSSTCGYFTFSCNIVYGANGRSKICRPKAPSNGKC